MTNKALRYNEGKPRWSLVDFKALEPLVQVLEYGAKKYTEDNWKLDMEIRTAIDSLLRHAIKLSEGELVDQESGLPHTGHIQANALFIQHHLNKGKTWPVNNPPTVSPIEVKEVEYKDCVVFKEDYAERRASDNKLIVSFVAGVSYPIYTNERGKEYILCPLNSKSVFLPIIFAQYDVKRCFG
jgi:hypothetical protein